MKNKFPHILSILLIAQSSFAQADYSKLYKQCLPAIIKIITTDITGNGSSGTAFFIDDKGTAVTCHHVIDQAHKILLYSWQGKQYTIDTILKSNKQLDLVVFRIKLEPKQKIKYLKISSKIPETGEAAFAIGNPNGYDFSATTGIMRLILFEGQNLNFATSALYLKDLKDDNTIQKIIPQIFKLNPAAVDSIQKYANALVKANKHKEAVNFLIPNLQYFKGDTLIDNAITIGECFFQMNDYINANKYYAFTMQLINAKKELNASNKKDKSLVFCYNGFALFMVGAKEQGCADLLKAIDNSKKIMLNDTALNNIDSSYFEIHRVIIQ